MSKNLENKNEVLTKSKLQQWCEDKTTNIISDVQQFFVECPEYKSMNVYPIFSKILSRDNKLLKLKERKFDDPEDVEFCFQCFQDIMATINLKVVYVPSIQTFCMFMGWTSRIYKQMLNDSPEEIQDMMQVINEYILENQISAGQQGILKQNLTKFRAQIAGDQGQNLVTQKEQNEENRSNKKIKSKEELLKDLKNMGYKVPTEISSKQKS
ncbi:hypothetical protein KEC48_03430 [Clostridium sp. C1]|uniref:hypothetical protein n=1 Tax=Clostridium sp. C1 TaxID=1155388 RepID=UPI001BA8A65C|nr:hypothetical protein [Clostridium sp. C1]QUN13591.1 hypothetical protein KEC48_03430 [Clostridium sp. C1]